MKSNASRCERHIHNIAPPMSLSCGQARTAGTPLKSIRGREEVSLFPCRIVASCLPQQVQWNALVAPDFAITAPLHFSLHCIGTVPVALYIVVKVLQEILPSLTIRFLGANVNVLEKKSQKSLILRDRTRIPLIIDSLTATLLTPSAFAISAMLIPRI